MSTKIFTTAALLALPFMTVIADDWQTLVVNGQIQSAKATRLTFDGDNVNITLDNGRTLTADMEAVSITFDWSTATGIDCPQSVFSEPSSYAAFDLQGRRVETPSKGIYILRNGDKTIKVVKR